MTKIDKVVEEQTKMIEDLLYSDESLTPEPTLDEYLEEGEEECP